MKLLVLELSSRCDQRCVHCAIWEGPPAAGPALTLPERLKVVEEALAAGAREALLTGGEPLLSPDLWPIAARLRAGRARVLLSTNGMALAGHAEAAARLLHEVYVSLDGADAATHDGLRGPASFDRLAAGIEALRRFTPRPRIVLRSVVHGHNAGQLAETVESARRLGGDHISFLPIDVSSEAFGGAPAHRVSLVPAALQVNELRRVIDRLEAGGAFRDGFILESADKLRRLARHLDASGGRAPFERPRCDAPRWSSVVTADGRVKPCFFHAAVGDVREGLARRRASPDYRAALTRIEAPNDTCARCVCPKWRGSGWRQVFG